mmetsp:Transcript_12076/g.24489  ORF Transcript_12076/g.24489 Transcript_12076/m.24489 type:complete len:359 (+) Transcript_12076:122-1198(+)
MAARASAEELRLRARQGMRRQSNLVSVDPHGCPEKGGQGYLPRERTKAIEKYANGVRDPASLAMSVRTVQRWNKRVVEKGPGRASIENAQDSARGRHRGVTDFQVALVHLAKTAHPTISAAELIEYVHKETGVRLAPCDISRCITDYNPFETLSRQKIESHASEGCPVLRTMWHHRSPPLGHFGVSTASAIDIDETCFYLDHVNRTIGHCRPGSTPIEDQSHAMNTKFTFVLGIDALGASFPRLQEENLNEEGWISFLQVDLFPHCGPNRVPMYDNLGSHVTPRAQQVIIQAGHKPLARPPYSPWLAPIEFIFGLMEAHLRRPQHLANAGNFRRCIMHAFRAAVTPATCAAVFRHCGL